MGSFRTLSLFDDEAVLVLGGSLGWIPVRRRLGAGAFGTNAYRADHAGDAVIEDHVESPGQEEMYVVIRGSVRMEIGGEYTEAREGDVVFLPDPAVRRAGVALEDDTVVLAVGGWPDQAYHSLPWEPIFLAQDAMRRGDWAEAAETLDREAGEHIDTGIVQFRLACCHAQTGEYELALEELHRALELSPGLRAKADDDALLEPLRGVEGWPG